MKIKIILSSLFLLTCSYTFAQWNTIWSINNNNFTSKCFALSKDTVYIGAEFGKIYRTFNGGGNWDSTQTIFTSSWILDIDFPSKQVGYACGGTAFGIHRSLLAKTTDGGISWDSLTANAFGYSFDHMSVLNDSVAYFAGDQFARTSDGGKTFSTVHGHTTNGTTTALHFFDKDTGFVCVREYMNSSTSGNRVVRTENGGNTWTTVYSDSGNYEYTSIDFRNRLNGYIIQSNGKMLVSSNGGQSWTLMPVIGGGTTLRDFSFSKKSMVAYACGFRNDSTSTEGSIYKSTDGGFNWNLNYHTQIEGIFSIGMADDDVVYASSYRNVFKTSNGGSTGIKSREESDGMNVYPNPSNGLFTIALGTWLPQVEIRLINYLGETVWVEKMTDTDKINLDITTFAPGVYLVQVNQRTIKYKIIKE